MYICNCKSFIVMMIDLSNRLVDNELTKEELLQNIEIVSTTYEDAPILTKLLAKCFGLPSQEEALRQLIFSNAQLDKSVKAIDKNNGDIYGFLIFSIFPIHRGSPLLHINPRLGGFLVQFSQINGHSFIIDERFRGTAGHEYMHAIQNGSYNARMSKWFKEAMAEWGKIVVVGCPDNTGGNMKSFIESSSSYLGSTANQNAYASVIFPLTITKKYNGSFLPFIKIYEELANLNNYQECTQDQLITAINNGLSKYGSSLRYPQIHNAMYSYMVNPAQWFGEFGASSPEADWGHLTPYQTETISQTNLEGTKTGQVKAHSAKYIKFKFASGLAGDIRYQITFTNSSCLSSKYVTQTDDGADHVLSTKAGSTTGYFITYGKEYSNVGLVLTNPTSIANAQYTISYTFTPKEIKNSQTSYISFGPNNLQYYDGHGHTWYQLDLTFSVTDVQPLDYDSIEVLGYDFRGYGSFSSRDIYFDSYDSAFHAIFISDSGFVFGRIRILYSYKATL